MRSFTLLPYAAVVHRPRQCVSSNRLRVALPARASTAVADDTERQAKTSKADVGSWNGEAGTKRLAHLEVTFSTALFDSCRLGFPLHSVVLHLACGARE